MLGLQWPRIDDFLKAHMPVSVCGMCGCCHVLFVACTHDMLSSKQLDT